MPLAEMIVSAFSRSYLCGSHEEVAAAGLPQQIGPRRSASNASLQPDASLQLSVWVFDRKPTTFASSIFEFNQSHALPHSRELYCRIRQMGQGETE